MSPAADQPDPPASSATDAAPSEAPAAVRVLRPLRLTDPLRWLRAGFADLRAAPAIALFYGVCFWLMALVLGAVFRNVQMSWTDGDKSALSPWMQIWRNARSWAS